MGDDDVDENRGTMRKEEGGILSKKEGESEHEPMAYRWQY
jgi:hypothetical protein